MSGVHLVEKRVSGVLSHSMHEPAFHAMLTQYTQLLTSVYGPRATSILVCNAAGRETLVSSSSEIIREVCFAHPCVKYINAMMSAQNTSCGLNGLYAGLLCVKLLKEILRCEEELPHAAATCISEFIIIQLMRKLEESPTQVVLDLDIGELNQIMAFVKTILVAKSTLKLISTTVDSLSLNIVKAFLKSVPDEYTGQGFGHVTLLTQEESSSVESRVYDGVLYREPDLCFKNFAKLRTQSSIIILLFSVALTYTDDDTVSVRWQGNKSKEENFISTVLPHLKRTMKERGIHILMNQKPVNAVIKFELERDGWLVLERLGTNLTEAVQHVSGCRPITSLTPLPHQLSTAVLGTLTSVECVEIGSKNYILLDHCHGNVTSLLLPAVSPTILSTLKETVESCLSALRMVVVDRKVMAGGGCFETWAASQVAHLLSSTIYPPDTSPHHLAKVGGKFVQVLMELALLPSGGLPTKLDWSVDSTFNHLWHTPPKIERENNNADERCIPEHCVCGLVQREVVKYKNGGMWNPLDIKLNHLYGFSPQSSRKQGNSITCESNEGSCSSKEFERSCIEQDSLEGSNRYSEEEDSLEKIVNYQEGEIDSLEGRLDSCNDNDVDSLEGMLDSIQGLECKKEIPSRAKLEGHVPGALYDSFTAKFNALRLAFEGFMQLLQIGQCVFDK